MARCTVVLPALDTSLIGTILLLVLSLRPLRCVWLVPNRYKCHHLPLNIRERKVHVHGVYLLAKANIGQIAKNLETFAQI